jgi:hypothetical protein
LVLGMAPSIARTLPSAAGSGATNSLPNLRRCVTRFTSPAIYFAGAATPSEPGLRAGASLRDNPEVSVRSRGRSADDGRCGATSLKPD